MNLRDDGGPAWPVARALRVVGATGVVLGLATVVGAALAYAQDLEFSLLRTYLSDMGNTPGWPQVIFNTGMLLSAPVRYAFLVLLLARLVHLGAPQSFRRVALVVGAAVVIGSVGTAAVPFSLQLRVHMGSAFLYFLGTVVLQSMIAHQEWRRGLPPLLPVLSLAMVSSYLVFAMLLAMVGKVEGVTRETPVVWEWIAFASVMAWLAGHTWLLGRGPRERAAESGA
jgi:hypothetical membrane protein